MSAKPAGFPLERTTLAAYAPRGVQRLVLAIHCVGEVMKKTSCLAALFSAVLSLPGLAAAASIAVHNTGVNASDVLVAPAAQASFWTLSGEPAMAVEAIGSNPFRYYNGAYFPDTGTAAWVSPQAGGNAGVQGIYTYDLNVDLTGLDPASASFPECSGPTTTARSR
jgi:hypothetical protein